MIITDILTPNNIYYANYTKINIITISLQATIAMKHLIIINVNLNDR